MSIREIDHLVEARILEARANGTFDDLSGEPVPLRLDDLDGLTAAQSFEVLFFRNSGEVPEEVRLLREVRAARAALAGCADEAACDRLRVTLRQKSDEVAALFAERRAEAAAERARPRLR